MKPTKEIIKLSEKLHKLGHRQEKIDLGDWYYNPDHPYRKLYIYDSYLTSVKQRKEFLMHLPFIIPIPSLENGLLWLRKRFPGEGGVCIKDYEEGAHSVFHYYRWACSYRKAFGKEYCVPAITPHEAVLKAMVKVLESK